MELLKKTQTLIGSFITNIKLVPFHITRRKSEDQDIPCHFERSEESLANASKNLKQVQRSFVTRLAESKLALFLRMTLILLLILNTFPISPAYAIVDPLAVSNNKFGIHIISPTTEEAAAATDLVNNQGDWGYITVLIESKDFLSESQDVAVNKWQAFFDYLRQRHLIPLIRIATAPEGNFWKVPEAGTEHKLAEFLNKLNWPVKNRYIIIYNEPNHGTEWGNSVDPVSYAQVLNQTIDALKAQNEDFYVLNAGLDASTPQQPPAYMDQALFMQQMDEAVPGIFDKLDGWVSHSYPNPGFMGLPEDKGRGTIRTWEWELLKLKQLGVSKPLPVFITETGWKHSEGIIQIPTLPSPETIAEYYKKAFETAWNNDRIVAVTPFLLNYQQPPFDHFSFKKITGEKQDAQVLAAKYPPDPAENYFPHYLTLQQMPKQTGAPIQETKASLTEGSIFHSLGVGEKYDINLVFKNTGQSIWNDGEQVKLVPLVGGEELEIAPSLLPLDQKIAPGEQYVFPISLRASRLGDYRVILNLFIGDKQFDTEAVEFIVEAKSPVVLIVKAKLKWKDQSEGEYVLSIRNGNHQTVKSIQLSESGTSEEIKQLSLLPDYAFEFTLQKPYYEAKTINTRVSPGVNTINFGTLQPDILSTIFTPAQLWQVLPFSH